MVPMGAGLPAISKRMLDNILAIRGLYRTTAGQGQSTFGTTVTGGPDSDCPGIQPHASMQGDPRLGHLGTVLRAVCHHNRVQAPSSTARSHGLHVYHCKGKPKVCLAVLGRVRPKLPAGGCQHAACHGLK